MNKQFDERADRVVIWAARISGTIIGIVLGIGIPLLISHILW
jgi:hypothetical protein